MKRLIALGAILIGGTLALQALSRERRGRLATATRARIVKKMERMMASLPEGSPPKLIMAVLPRLRDQNDQIIRLLREQNQLLRERESLGSGHAP